MGLVEDLDPDVLPRSSKSGKSIIQHFVEELVEQGRDAEVAAFERALQMLARKQIEGPELGRRLHRNGFFTDMSLHNLSQSLRRYARDRFPQDRP